MYLQFFLVVVSQSSVTSVSDANIVDTNAFLSQKYHVLHLFNDGLFLLSEISPYIDLQCDDWSKRRCETDPRY